MCKDCNDRAGREIDDPLAAFLMVQMPKALSNVRSLGHQKKDPVVEVDGVISTTGDPVRVRFRPQGREAHRPDGTRVEDVVEVSYGMHADLWVRFIAKVALGCGAKLLSDDWLDDHVAVAVRALLWNGPIDDTIWPNGLPGWPGELEAADPVRQALGDDRHLVGIAASDDVTGSSVAVALLFGGQISCGLPLPGVAVQGSGSVWVIDWHPDDPPPQEDFDQAIERMLRERGWSTAQINAVRLS